MIFSFNFWKKISENTVGQKFSNTISMMLMAVTIDNMKKYFSSKDLEWILLNFANKIWFFQQNGLLPNYYEKNLYELPYRKV